MQISEDTFLRLPYRIRLLLSRRISVLQRVGASNVLVPAAIDIAKWRASLT